MTFIFLVGKKIICQRYLFFEIVLKKVQHFTSKEMHISSNLSECGTHKSINEKVDTGVECHQAMRNRCKTEGPNRNTIAIMLNAFPECFKSKEFVDV